MPSLGEVLQIEKLNIKKNLDRVADENRELELYEELYDLIENCHEEIQNKVTNDFYEQFFSFINRAEIQDNILFQDPQNYEKIFKLYNLKLSYVDEQNISSDLSLKYATGALSEPIGSCNLKAITFFLKYMLHFQYVYAIICVEVFAS